MKKIIVVFLLSLMLLCGCEGSSNNSANGDKVIVNMPTDNSVGGYRISSSFNSLNDLEEDSKASSSSVSSYAESDNKQKTDSTFDNSIVFYANKNTKKFHKKDCAFAKKINEENLFITSNRQELIDDSYTPCKKCCP